MAAIAWSYAAARCIGMDSAFVLHEHGYREGSTALLNNFDEGCYIGVPMLQWLGLTLGRV